MPITPENLPKHELIGLQVEVTESTDESLEGLKGEVMDETKSMLRINDKWVEKKNCTFLFQIPAGEKVSVKGQLINKRPEERTGMKLPEKW
ncbi:ribonuclease P protein component 1 [Candidatus Nanohalovita haloferacivicina]|uniref:ribonuclease P protein component 1 n=1 Tax=Candidatus Nanohalovita haloferacivicina TaxID=2978046 RepID=UPI00325FD044|nr:Ribonuclease P protein subunit POP4 [Candidatus Nanohalobia archaeon BNXNv]